MRVLILDENSKRAREAADSLHSWDGEIVTETSPAQEGLGRLEKGEWFDLVVADPNPGEAAASVYQRLGRLSGPPPLLLVSAPRLDPPPPPWVQGVLPREPGYLARLPEAARLTMRVHRLRLQVGHLESQLAFERESAAAHRTSTRESLESLHAEIHALLHSLHSLVAEGALESEDDLSPWMETALERGESAWNAAGRILRNLDEQGQGADTHSRAILSSGEIVREALAAGLRDEERDRITVEVVDEGNVFADGRVLASALGCLVRACLLRGDEEVLLRAWNEEGRVFFQVDWNDPRFLPDEIFAAARSHDGEAGIHDGHARFWIPSVREADIPGVLVGAAIHEAECEAGSFTLMKIEGGGGPALEPGLLTPILKSTDKVLATPEGGLLLLLGGLSIENTWSVAERIRNALAEVRSFLPFRTLSYPAEASTATEFLERVRRMAMLGLPD